MEKKSCTNKKSRRGIREAMKIRFSGGEQAAVHIPQQMRSEGKALNLDFMHKLG